MKKILVTATTFPRWKGDTEPPFVYDLSNGLAKHFDITVLVPHYPEAKKFEIMDKLKVYRFKYFFGKYQKLCYSGGILPNLKKNKLLLFQVPFLMIAEYFAIRKLLKKEKFDLIHAHWIIPQGFIATLIKKKFNTPYIVTSHGTDILGHNNFLINKMIKKSIINSKKITVVSRYLKNKIKERYNINKVNVISMGIDIKLFNPNNKDNNIKKKYKINGPFLLFVGRLAPEKGVKYLIEAIPEIIKNYSKTKLLIIGDGPERKKLELIVKKKGLENNILFIGNMNHEELAKYYATADIFIGPSIREGAGLTFIEALSSGCIVIGTDEESIKENIINNVNGLIINKKDSKSVSKVVINLLNNEKLRKRLINNSQEYIKNNFSWDSIVNKFNKIYREI